MPLGSELTPLQDEVGEELRTGSLTRRFALHRRIARLTFPIWLYVSITGVVVFVFLKASVYENQYSSTWFEKPRARTPAAGFQTMG